MRHLFPMALLLLALIPCRAQSGSGRESIREVTPQELSMELAQPSRAGLSVRVIDVNEPDSYAEAHVPGAILLVYDAIRAADLPADKSSPLVFYCWSAECPAAETAAQSALKLGYTDVSCMKTGITGWRDAGLPTEP